MQWRRCAARWRPPASEIRIGLCGSTVEPRRGLTVDELKGYTAASWGEGRSGAEAVRASLHEQAPQRAEAEHHDSGDGGSRQDTALLGGEAQRREGVRARVNQGRCGDSLRMRRAGRERCEGDEAPQRTDGSGKGARGAVGAAWLRERRCESVSEAGSGSARGCRCGPASRVQGGRVGTGAPLLWGGARARTA